MSRSHRAVLINSALIASLFIAIALGNGLGGAWNYLFPIWILTLCDRDGRSAPSPIASTPGERSISPFAHCGGGGGGFSPGGLPLALVGGIGAGLAVLLVLGIERFS